MVFMPLDDGFCFGFQMMKDKAKDRLVLSAIWCWEALRVA